MFKKSLSKMKKVTSFLLATMIIITSLGLTALAEVEDGKLSSLTVSEGTLYPAFDPDVKSYTVVVDSLSSLPTITAALPDGSSEVVEIVQPAKTINYIGMVGIKADSSSTPHAMYTVTVTTADKVLPIASSTYYLDGVEKEGKNNWNVDGTYTDLYLTDTYDSNVATRWINQKNQETQYVFTLKKWAEVSAIRLWTRGGNYDDQQYLDDISYSVDGDEWVSAAATVTENGQAQIKLGAYINSYEITFDSAITAKHIRLNIPENYPTIFNEIMILGEEKTEDEPQPQPVITGKLESLSINQGTLYPDFDPDIKSYTAVVDSLSSLPTITATLSEESTEVVEIVQPAANVNYISFIGIKADEASAPHAMYTVTVTTGSEALPIDTSKFFIDGTESEGKFNVNVGGTMTDFFIDGAYDDDITTAWRYKNVAKASQHVFSLEKWADVSSIRILTRGGNYDDQEFLDDVSYSVDGSTWTDATVTVTETAQAAIKFGAYVNSYEITFNSPVAAKHLRLNIPANYDFRANEVKVLGTEKSEPEPTPDPGTDPDPTPEPAESGELKTLSISSGTLYPAFDPKVKGYTAVIDDLNSLPTITATLPQGSTEVVEVIPATKARNYNGVVGIKAAGSDEPLSTYTITFTTADKVLPIASSKLKVYGNELEGKFTWSVNGTMTDFYITDAYDSDIVSGWRYQNGSNDSEHIFTLNRWAEISSIRVWTRGGNYDDQEFLDDVRYSANGRDWTNATVSVVENGQAQLYFGSLAYVNSYEIKFSSPITAKHLSINIPANYHLNLKEIMILGQEKSEPEPPEPIDTTLSSLTLTSGELAQTFSSEVFGYTAELKSFRKIPELVAVAKNSEALVDIVQPTASNGYKGSVTVTDPADDTNCSVYAVQYTPEITHYDITARGDLSFKPWTTNFPVEMGCDGNVNTATKGQMTPGNVYTVDLGAEKMVSSVYIYQGSTQRSDLIKLKFGRVEGSLDGKNFFLLSENYTHVPFMKYIDGQEVYSGITHVLPEAVLTRFVRVTNTATDADVAALGATAAELSITEVLVNGYVISEAYISDEALNSITRDINPLMDCDMVLGGNEYSVEWECDSDAIDMSTGRITKTADSQNVTLTATLTLKSNPQIVLPQTFNLTILGNTFVDAVDAYDESAFTLSNAAERTLETLSVPEPFTLDVDTLVEFEIKKDETQKGSVVFKTDAFEILNIAFNENGFVFNYGEGSSKEWKTDAEKVTFKLEMFDTSFNLYADTGDDYFIKLYKAPYKQAVRGYINNVVFKTEGTGAVSVNKFDYDVCGNQVFETLAEQISFDKISSEKPFALTQNLNLITNIFDGFNLEWSSTSSAISIPDGTVTLPENAEYAELSVRLSYRNETPITKTWAILMGMDNLLKGMQVSPSVVPSGLNYASYVTDSNGETSFITSKKEYNVDINLSSAQSISHFDIFAADTDGSIKSAKVMASEDGKNFTEVWSGELPAGKTSAAITPVKAKVFRISVIATEGLNTGIAEAIAYFAPNDEQKMDADLEGVKIPDVLSEGLELPAVGTYGSQITYSSDNSDVKFEKEGDKFVVSVEDVDYDSNVTITCTVNSEDGTSKTKTFYVLVYGNLDIRDNKPSGGSMGGGGGSGGGGGGGSSVDYTTEPVAPVQPAPETEKVYTVWDEIGEHWASEEVGYLYQKGIVKGDGKSLNLNGQITRAEFITLLLRAMNIEVSKYDGVFSDVSANDWYSGYIQTAYEKGIMKGDGTNVRPNDLITREEMATILANYLTESPETESDSMFTDMDSASSWAQDNIKKVTALGIINGYEDGSFGPMLKLTRAEAMVVFYRMMNAD